LTTPTGPEGGQPSGLSSSPARIGILALDTRFPRIPGDVGNPATWPFPVRIETVRGATPERVVHHRAEGLFDAFAEHARALVADGVEAIVTTCGFLTLMQDNLRRAAGAPVLTSALMQVPLVESMLAPGQRVGILTASARSLTPAHLLAAGAPADAPIAGVPENGAFSATFLGNAPTLDEAVARREVVDAARRLMEQQARIGALVLECANMGPYAADVRRETGLPTYDMVSLVTWLHLGLQPRVFPSCGHATLASPA